MALQHSSMRKFYFETITKHATVEISHQAILYVYG